MMTGLGIAGQCNSDYEWLPGDKRRAQDVRQEERRSLCPCKELEEAAASRCAAQGDDAHTRAF